MPRIRVDDAVLRMGCARASRRGAGWRAWAGLLTVLLLACPAVERQEEPGLASFHRRPNIAIFVLDAARADHFGAYGYHRDTTPRIDVFGRDAIRYATVLSEASYTFLSTSALLSGASPAATGLGARSGGRIPGSLELLAEAATSEGYGTWGYSENPYVTGYFGMNQGFEVFEEAYPIDVLRSGEEPGEGLETAAALAGFVDAIAEDRSRPFLFYAHVLRPHNPYAPPPPYAGRFGSGDLPDATGSTAALVALDQQGPPFDAAQLAAIETRYDENLAYGDALFGGFLDALEREGLLEETIVVLTSDHGDAFGEHGRLLHSTQLFDEMLRVPLFVRIPDQAGEVAARPIQLADLGRGLRQVVEGAPARSLAALGSTRASEAPLFSWTNAATGQLAAWRPGRRLILDLRSMDVAGYFDLTVDAGCTTDLPLDAEGRRLAQAARAAAQAWMGEAPSVSTPGLDPRRRAQLEALGYLDP